MTDIMFGIEKTTVSASFRILKSRWKGINDKWQKCNQCYYISDSEIASWVRQQPQNLWKQCDKFFGYEFTENMEIMFLLRWGHDE